MTDFIGPEYRKAIPSGNSGAIRSVVFPAMGAIILLYMVYLRRWGSWLCYFLKSHLGDIRFSILHTSHICNRISKIAYQYVVAMPHIKTPHFNVGDQAHPNPESAINAASISNEHTLEARRMTQNRK